LKKSKCAEVAPAVNIPHTEPVNEDEVSECRRAAAAEHGVPVDRFAREILAFLGDPVQRSRQLNANPLGRNSRLSKAIFMSTLSSDIVKCVITASCGISA
jgi:hypothetical protein